MQARKVQDTPFPFAHAQMCVAGLLSFAFFIPIVFNAYFSQEWLLYSLTWVTVWLYFSLNEICRELEDPYCHEPNDIQLAQLAHDFNNRLFAAEHGIRANAFFCNSQKVKSDQTLHEAVDEESDAFYFAGRDIVVQGEANESHGKHQSDCGLCTDMMTSPTRLMQCRGLLASPKCLRPCTVGHEHGRDVSPRGNGAFFGPVRLCMLGGSVRACNPPRQKLTGQSLNHTYIFIIRNDSDSSVLHLPTFCPHTSRSGCLLWLLPFISRCRRPSRRYASDKDTRESSHL